MKYTYTSGYPYGEVTLEQLERLFNNYGIASICCADSNGYYVESDHIIKYFKKEV